MANGQTGYQPRNTPAERRAFFDLQRQIRENGGGGGGVTYPPGGADGDVLTKQSSADGDVAWETPAAGDPLDAWPVGSIYTSVIDTNPSTYFGGTWIEVDIFPAIAATSGGGWTGAVTLRASYVAGSDGVPAITSGTFAPAANSKLFVQHSHSAAGHATPPDVQITNTAGLTFTRYLTDVWDFAGANDVQGALFVADVGGSPSAMTVTVDPFLTSDIAYQTMVVYDVTEASIVQGPIAKIGDFGETHTTNPLPAPVAAGNLTIVGFSKHTVSTDAPATPAGFTPLVNQNTTYQSQSVFYSTTNTATTATSDLGSSIYITASWIMEIGPIPELPVLTSLHYWQRTA